jgi:hypothetical protein
MNDAIGHTETGTIHIAAINGSPRGASSNSREILDQVASFFPPNAAWSASADLRSSDAELRALCDAHALVIAFPLYVDGLPASLISLLGRYGELYQSRRESNASGSPLPQQRVFAVSNCGFYEGRQNECAIQMISHFCRAFGLDWCGGAGIGTGEMVRAVKSVPPQAGIRKPVVDALRSVSAAAAAPAGRLGENLFVQHGFPWILYKISGELGWRKQARANGLRRKDLFARPLTD